MNFYQFSGPDSSSDTGAWYMVVKADSKDQAIKIGQQVLKAKGRWDLVLGEPELLSTAIAHGVVSTNIESRMILESEPLMEKSTMYPQEMPLDSVKELFRIVFQDHSLDSEYQKFVQEGWWVAGYGLKVGVGEPSGKFAAAPSGLPDACSDTEAHDMMAGLINADDQKYGAVSIDWLSLAMWIIEIIRKRRS